MSSNRQLCLINRVVSSPSHRVRYPLPTAHTEHRLARTATVVNSKQRLLAEASDHHQRQLLLAPSRQPHFAKAVFDVRFLLSARRLLHQRLGVAHRHAARQLAAAAVAHGGPNAA
jgi:hypothetical protein